MSARATDAQEFTSFPGMTYQTGLGPACVISGTAAAGTSVVVDIDKGGAVGVATFRYSLDGGTTWLAEDTLTAGSNSIGTTGLTMTWGTSEVLVLGAKYAWTNVPVSLANRLTKEVYPISLKVLDCASTASVSVTTGASPDTARTLTLTEGETIELDARSIASAVGLTRLRAYWGDY